MPINNLTAVDSVSAGDQLAIGSTSNGDDRRAPISVLQTYLQSALTFSDTAFTTQYSTPLTGASVTITPNTSNTHLIITPAGTIANLTLVMPVVPGAVDKQELLVNCTQAVTNLAFTVNGASAVVGAPSSLSANDYFRLKYDSINNNWYRVG